jgi:hypothetical protein
LSSVNGTAHELVPAPPYLIEKAAEWPPAALIVSSMLWFDAFSVGHFAFVHS